jgi:Cu/Zn superoxide dismutase
VKLTARILASALAATLVLAVVASAAPEATSFQVRASLSATQEVPPPAGDVSGASGSFTGHVMKEDSASALSWQLSYTGLTGNAIAAHIHQGEPGHAGPIVTFLCGPCQSPISGTARLPTQALRAIQNGEAYVNVHTPTNSGGEIRGQVVITANVTTTLTPRQEVPKPKGDVARATANFTGTVTKQLGTGSIAWRLRFSGLTGKAVAAHIHLGPKGKAGPIAVSLCGPCRNGARGSARLSAAILKALQTGRAYVNVHTPKNPAGEVRGQIGAVPLSLTE